MNEKTNAATSKLIILVVIVIIALAGVLVYAVFSPSSDEKESTNESVSQSTSLVQNLSPVEFKQFMNENEDAVVIDVHTPIQEHINKSDLFIPYDTISESVELPVDKDTPIAVYCRSGSMSGIASEDLEALGYTNVANLEGGINAWNAEFAE